LCIAALLYFGSGSVRSIHEKSWSALLASSCVASRSSDSVSYTTGGGGSPLLTKVALLASAGLTPKGLGLVTLNDLKTLYTNPQVKTQNIPQTASR